MRVWDCLNVVRGAVLTPLRQIHARAQQAFKSGKTKSIAFRKEQIAQVGYLVKDNEERFKEALKQDLGRPFLETELCVRLDRLGHTQC